MHARFRIANLVVFQMVWLACVWGAGVGMAWFGPLAAALFVTWHLRYTDARASDLRLIAIAIPMGIVADGLFAASGWFDYASPWPAASVAPVWIIAMWVGFALTLNHSMAFLRGRMAWAALFGLIGGPLAYWGAASGFAAVHFTVPTLWALTAVAVAWGLALPALYLFESRWSKHLAVAGAPA